MADRFAELAVGNNNWSSVNTWKATTDGATGASVPTSADNVYVNADSVQGAGATLTVDAVASCLDMDWTGATNTPTLAGASGVNIYGSLTFIAGMSVTASGLWDFKSVGAATITTAGQSVPFRYYFTGAGPFTLQDTLTTTNGDFQLVTGTLDINGQTINIKSMTLTAAGVRTLTLGAATVNCTAWAYTGTNLTVTANTATINISGTGALAGGDVDYNGADFNLNGSAHTLSGDFTCINLTLPAATTQTITLTAGEVIRCTVATLDGDATHLHTFGATGAPRPVLISKTRTDDYVVKVGVDLEKLAFATWA